MIYILENDKLKVKISSMGAELQSIRRLEDDIEYLWQGDATYWASRATNLFPTCGRMIEGKYTYAGETYEIPIHGFAKLQEWTVLHQKSNAITLQIQDTAETRGMYPFKFSLEIAYTLTDETLSVAMIVHNLDDKTMIFAVGGHPGFNLPLAEGPAFEDYYIEFDKPCQPEKLCLSATCFYLNRTEPFPLEEDKRLAMKHSLFDNDAIFLTGMSDGVTLKCDGNPRYVHLSYPDMKFLGLWHKPHTEAPYVCIEPWTGVPALDGGINSLEEKLEMIHLEPQDIYRNAYSITFG